MNTENTETRFATKIALAKRYGVCKRTIDEWMRAGLLVYIKVRRVVRFDVLSCDENLKKHGMVG